MIGIMQVYPAMNRFARESRFDEDGRVMEIYDIPGRKIVYRWAKADQELNTLGRLKFN